MLGVGGIGLGQANVCSTHGEDPLVRRSCQDKRGNGNFWGNFLKYPRGILNVSGGVTVNYKQNVLTRGTGWQWRSKSEV